MDSSLGGANSFPFRLSESLKVLSLEVGSLKSSPSKLVWPLIFAIGSGLSSQPFLWEHVPQQTSWHFGSQHLSAASSSVVSSHGVRGFGADVFTRVRRPMIC